MKTKITHLPIIPLFQQFISETEKGKRLQKNGLRVLKSTLNCYRTVMCNLRAFEESTEKKILVNINLSSNKRDFLKEAKYYSTFYNQFTNFLYAKNCKDNYVGMVIKLLRTFFAYLNETKGYHTGLFYKKFYARHENIPIITLSPVQLQMLIKNKEFEKTLTPELIETKDMFVIGCTTGLRFSDLSTLKWHNVQEFNGKKYLISQSKKTKTEAKVKLPQYAIDILDKNRKNKKQIFKPIYLSHFNKNCKIIAELAGWNAVIGKHRQIKGKPSEIKLNGKSYRFCDLISSHTMRRTAITTLLNLGVKEQTVRSVSGHSPTSHEFYKYVKYSDSLLDFETDKAFAQLVE